jgi:hypothetical protein
MGAWCITYFHYLPRRAQLARLHGTRKLPILLDMLAHRAVMLAALAVVCHPGAFAADIVISGALERLQSESIAIRLADGRLRRHSCRL